MNTSTLIANGGSLLISAVETTTTGTYILTVELKKADTVLLRIPGIARVDSWENDVKRATDMALLFAYENAADVPKPVPEAKALEVPMAIEAPAADDTAKAVAAELTAPETSHEADGDAEAPATADATKAVVAEPTTPETSHEADGDAEAPAAVDATVPVTKPVGNPDAGLAKTQTAGKTTKAVKKVEPVTKPEVLASMAPPVSAGEAVITFVPGTEDNDFVARFKERGLLSKPLADVVQSHPGACRVLIERGLVDEKTVNAIRSLMNKA